jgi:EVE domain
MTRYWLGVVSREHVRRGVQLGIAQVNHGRRAPLQRMQPGDGLVYYSPRERIRDGAEVKAFTAIGTIDDSEPWQADEGDFQPWRRAVTYDTTAREAPVRGLPLELTSAPDWGVRLRGGLLELSRHDFDLIADAMTGR